MIVIKWLNDKFKSTFLKNVMMITGGTAFAQVIGIVLLPVITRLYTPEQYGVISVYAAILPLLNILGSMNYEKGIPIAESEEKAINVLSLSIITLIFFNSLITLLLTFWGEGFLTFLNGNVLIDFKLFIPLGVFFMGLYSIFTQWAYRKKNFKDLTKTKFSQAISQNMITIIFGILGKGPIGLLLGKISGQSAGIITLSSPLFKRERSLLSKVKVKDILWAAKRYRSFPIFTTPRRFLGDITISLPVIMITSLYGTQAVGLFGLANSVIQLPMNLIGTSVSNVYYAESASLSRRDPRRIQELSRKLLRNLVLIGAIPLTILIFLGPLLFSLFFGSAWHQAGVYASLLSVVVFFRFIFKPISNIFDIYEKQKTALLLNVFSLLLVLAVFGISSYLSLKSYMAVGLYSIAMSLVYFIQYILAQRILNEEIKSFEKSHT
ncbi:lipopolysaccharide biosynthesis protein [Sporosarcina sp. UB5]|uniref:lipopolysaccharide biosynthesis protein n=1 Tax=Sporosarcina sp. UB5 TaxID=3047463 RepID=UPI003D7AFB08